jgi:transporter family-2 protein
MNAQTGNPVFTALLVFIAGLLSVLLTMVVRPHAAAAFWRLPSLLRSGALRKWQLFGGVSGATFVCMQSGLVAATGVAVFTVAAVAGQTAGALIVDRTGVGPSGRHPVTIRRVLAAVVGVGGVVVSVSGSQTGPVAIAAVAATLAAGIFVSSQPALNGQVAVKTGHPLAATLVNFIGGLIVLAGVLAVQQMLEPQPLVLPAPPWLDPVVWLGGPFGVFFVLIGAQMARILGVFVFTLTSVVGQLSGAVMLDLVFPTAATHITVQLISGLVITGLAVVLSSERT